MEIKYDSETKKWFLKYPYHHTTVCQCPKCELYYKLSLGHKCKKDKKGK